jgi:molybdopterin-guanine dinucleotide biosynthesis protein A
MTPSYSAALLAGGKSRRMGRDKALLPAPGFAFLWQRQLAVLQELAPRHVFWSGFTREGMAQGVTVVADLVAGAGPLAGIAACLDALESELLVVLAVDLPRMNAPFLHRLLLACTVSRGVVPKLDDRFEPLASVYPKEMLGIARRHLAEGRLALQDLARAGLEAGLLAVFDVAKEDHPLFHNLNRPEDLAQ